MNTADLADHLAASDSSLTKVKAKEILDTVLTALRDAAVKGEEVSLPGFGKFKVQDKPARQGRNPRTGETLEIAATKKLVFQPAKPLKDALAK
jgi:DNA-binding protein HU-beta